MIMGRKNETIVEDIKADILLSILKKVNPPIGAKHIPCMKFVKNIPPRLEGLAKKALYELIDEGFILMRPSHKGYEKCSLNHKRIKDS
jgi:hypothetical protein